MESYTVHYGFSQSFSFPAKDAFDWSMDYREDDMARMGLEGTRKIQSVNKDTLIITDTIFTRGKSEVKRRLIRIYPERLMMVNTRISRVCKYSQFIYEFVPLEEKKSRLDFTGAHVFYGKKPSSSKLASLARKMSEEDGMVWKYLAKAMQKDLSEPR
jgi:hypothetical protein